MLVFSFLAVDMIITIPLVIAAIIKNDTAFVRNKLTQSNINVSSEISSSAVIYAFNVGTRNNAKLYCSCLWHQLHFYVTFNCFYSLQICLHIIGLVLAFLTRNVEIDVLNNSKYIRKTLYCGTFVLIVTITIAPILSETENVDDIIWALIVFFSVIIFLGFNFIPKVSFIMNGRMHLIEVY